MSMHTYFRRLVKDGHDIKNLTITVASQDASGEYVERNDARFSHYKATWNERDSKTIHGGETRKVLEEAFQAAIDSIMTHFGPGHTVEG